MSDAIMGGSSQAGRVRCALAAVLLVGVSLVAVDSVSAATVGCGAVLTRDTTLSSDIGPCPDDGVVVASDNITLDLNGHTISGDPFARAAEDKAGVRLRRVRGVTVQDGTVECFDAGVAIIGGEGNVVRAITARDNVNYRVVTGRNASGEDMDWELGPFCDFGDGIAVFDSDDNLIEDNVVTGNGPYSGISLVSGADENQVRNNDVNDNDILNQPPSGVEGTVCGGDPDEVGPLGRHVQDSGIRIEGPSAQRNVIEQNQLHRNALAGVMITAFRLEFPEANNGFNVIRDNTISQTGLRTHHLVGQPPFADSYRSSGITVHNAGTEAVHISYGNIIEGNNSSENFGAGIELTGVFPGSGQVGQFGNTIRDNIADDNFLDGIHLAEGNVNTTVTGNSAHGNGRNDALIDEVTAGDPFSVWHGVDGADLNPRCDNNQWSFNRFGTVNQRCVASQGTGRVEGPRPRPAASAPSSSPLPAPPSTARRVFQ
ncbi:hypothetical protein BH18ACT4_BH18ACT4_02070 [soil metagenome]